MPIESVEESISSMQLDEVRDATDEVRAAASLAGAALAADPSVRQTTQEERHSERDAEWSIAYSPEIPGANGQGKTKEEALESLSEAIALILEDRREDGLGGVPPGAIREMVTLR